METDKTKINPGIHKDFRMERFGSNEQRIISKMKNEWYVTSSGEHVQMARSEYDFFLVKPTAAISEMFNLEREIVVVFSPYNKFEPRSLDVFERARQRFEAMRIETVCYIIISLDPLVETAADNLLKSQPEHPIVIPFTYDELLNSYDDYFFRNRFRKHFYTRDLFSFLSPLKKDTYFFGRSELLQEIVNRHRSGEHTGLFGLRKSGKTSIVYAIERHLKANGNLFISIDCEMPSIHQLRWNELLRKIVKDYYTVLGLEIPKTGDSYQEKNAATTFSSDMLKAFNASSKASVMILFDEIERISPKTGSSVPWRDGVDFIYFWQTLRGFFQRNPTVLTYMLVGTNPSCVEEAFFSGHENPLFCSVPSQYLPSFTYPQVLQMVRKLGRYMGLNFDEIVCAKLTEDLGGHPFLIRQVCSHLQKACKGDRPAVIDKALYEKVNINLNDIAGEYFEMMLTVLREWYPDEYEMLTLLAQRDLEKFNRLAQTNEKYTKHLLGYGLIHHGPNGYSFALEAVRIHLMKIHEYEKLNLSIEEKWTEITIRRNKIERELRTLVKNTLVTVVGRSKALQNALASLDGDRRTKLPNDLAIIFDREKSPLFFLDLINIIIREWEYFKNIFECEKDKANIVLREINKFGRPEAHAKAISTDEFTQLRLHFKMLEGILSTWSS
ncbi:MAG TPA: AAA-like domain-containing protein [bacterium]|jgi:hypothetical protein|nr:AAA-like domain-containing protein [bacterium]